MEIVLINITRYWIITTPSKIYRSKKIRWLGNFRRWMWQNWTLSYGGCQRVILGNYSSCQKRDLALFFLRLPQRYHPRPEWPMKYLWPLYFLLIYLHFNSNRFWNIYKQVLEAFSLYLRSENFFGIDIFAWEFIMLNDDKDQFQNIHVQVKINDAQNNFERACQVL